MDPIVLFLIIGAVIILAFVGLMIGRRQTKHAVPPSETSLLHRNLVASDKDTHPNRKSPSPASAVSPTTPISPLQNIDSTATEPSLSNDQPTETTANLSMLDNFAGATIDDEKIRVLIIDDNEETIDHVTRLLYFEEDMEVIGQATRGVQGLKMAAEKMPHIILMDINMPGELDGIETTQRMQQEVPFAQVIIISTQDDPEYMKRAMQAGAREYQSKPFTADQLVTTIRLVYERGQPAYKQFQTASLGEPKATENNSQSVGVQTGKQGQVVAVYSPKGGIGVSTIAVNLAIILQKIQGDVVLMDGDLQFGDIPVHLNIQASRNFSHLLQDDGRYDLERLPEILLSHSTGLSLLLAPDRPEISELVTTPLMTEVIDALRDQFGTVVIDTNNLLTDHTLAVLDNADYILLVTKPELPAIKNTKLFLDLSQELNLAAKRVDLIINQADKAGGINIKQVSQALKLPHTHQIPYDPQLITTINNGTIIIEHNGNSGFAKAITTLAEVLSSIFEQTRAKSPEVAIQV